MEEKNQRFIAIFCDRVNTLTTILKEHPFDEQTLMPKCIELSFIPIMRQIWLSTGHDKTMAFSFITDILLTEFATGSQAHKEVLSILGGFDRYAKIGIYELEMNWGEGHIEQITSAVFGSYIMYGGGAIHTNDHYKFMRLKYLRIMDRKSHTLEYCFQFILLTLYESCKQLVEVIRKEKVISPGLWEHFFKHHGLFE